MKRIDDEDRVPAGVAVAESELQIEVSCVDVVKRTDDVSDSVCLVMVKSLESVNSGLEVRVVE